MLPTNDFVDPSHKASNRNCDSEETSSQDECFITMRPADAAKLVDLALSRTEEVVALGLGKKRPNCLFSVELIRVCSNISDNPYTSFKADPQCLYDSIVEVEVRGLDITAIIHSHPEGAEPSRMDLEGMRLWPIPWIIIDRKNKTMRAWILIDGNLREIRLSIRGEST